MSKIPDKIWLILHEGLSIQSADWSIEKINPDDIEYILATRWTRVSDGLPEHGQFVWFVDAENGNVYKGQYIHDQKRSSFYWQSGAYTQKRQATHWQPFIVPQLPEDV